MSKKKHKTSKKAVASKKSRKNIVLPYQPKGEYFIEPIGYLPRKYSYETSKRAFDVAASAAGLVVLFVPMAALALAVKFSSKGPAFYRQERLGLNGKKITITKFRTMVQDAEKDCVRWSDDNDPRVTPLGAFLRKYHLDELPQLWDILMGDLSFVGPRPERECYYDAFETYIHGFRERLNVKPGLTGLAQVSGGYRMPPENKIFYDMEYIHNRSFLLDMKLIFKTLFDVFVKR